MKLAGIMVLSGDASGARAEAEEAAKSNPHFATPHVVMGALAERTVTQSRRSRTTSDSSGWLRGTIGP